MATFMGKNKERDILTAETRVKYKRNDVRPGRLIPSHADNTIFSNPCNRSDSIFVHGDNFQFLSCWANKELVAQMTLLKIRDEELIG